VTLSQAHRDYLNAHAITDETIERHSITSEGDEILFPWTDTPLATVQRRPWPGESGIYYWEKGKDLHFWNLRDAYDDVPILLVEGTKQSLAAASWAPEGFSVLGMAGCEGWNRCDLSRFEGRTVLVCLDADAGSNLSVYEAGDLFRQQAEFYDAVVKFLWLPARGTQGLDDVLAKVPEDKRSAFVQRLADRAQAKPAERRPATRKGAKMGTELPDTGDRIGVAINLDRKVVIDQITGAMKDRLDGVSLFNYGDVLTRVAGHETKPMDKDSFYSLIADTVACYRYTAATDKRPAVFDPSWPDPQTVGAVMSKADEFSTLKRVVRVPFLRPDGSVCSTPGYDKETATVLAPSGLTVDVPSNPSKDDVRAAAKFLMDEWLGDFPLLTDADRANALGLVLTPFIRGLVPLVPLAVVNGLEAGVGKNLLVDCVSLLATGTASEPQSWVSNGDEMRKQITAALAMGNEMLVFDEAHVIEGEHMARALTSLTYVDRVLGVSRMARFPNQVTWISLGNQVQVNGDMSRRVYFIALRPVGTTLEDRDSRSYRHPDIKLWTAENRAALVTAALTVLRGWWAAGQPAWSRGATLGSFEPWDRMMSSVTAFAGYPHFLTDVKERRSEGDFERSYWEAHLSWAREVFGGNEFTTRNVQEKALRDPAGFEAPPKMDEVSAKGYTRELGRAYSRHQDRRYGGLRLVKAGMGHKSTIKWRIDVDNGSSGGNGGNTTTPHREKKPSVGDDVTCVSRMEEGGPSLPSAITSDEPDWFEDPTPVHAPIDVTQPVAPPLPSCGAPVVLGFDIETASAEQLFTGGYEGDFVRLVGAAEDDGTWQYAGPMAGEFLEDLNRADVIYGHNILAFDLVALAKHHGADYDALAAKSIDTIVLARLADPPVAKGTPKGYYSLDQVAKRLGHTGKSDDLKALAKEHGGYDKIPVDDRRYNDYLRGDLAATKFAYDNLRMLHLPGESSATERTIKYAEREMRVAAIQNRMTLNGWGVNTELLAARVAAEDKMRELSVNTLRDRFGMPTDKVTYSLKRKADWPEEMRSLSMAEARSVRDEQPEKAVSFGIATEKREPYAAPWATDAGRSALEKALHAAGAEHLPTTASGALALSSDALGNQPWYDAKAGQAFPGLLQVYGDLPEVREIAELITQATGATAKYAEIAKFVTPAGRVHGEIGDVQASGRWAMVRPSLTNLGKRGAKVEQRRVFDESRDGMVHIACDLSQVDMRAIAGLCQDPAYMALFEPGKDAHMDMAEVYFGERTKEARNKTKAINHKVNYGGSADSTAEANGLDLDLVKAALAERARAYPKLIEWTQQVRELAAAGHLLDNGFGRLMRCNPDRAWTQAPALMGQGAARDLMCEGLLRLVDHYPAATKYLRGVVHDEVVLSVPEDHALIWQGRLREAFTFEWRDVPILCEVSDQGASWADCYAGE